MARKKDAPDVLWSRTLPTLSADEALLDEMQAVEDLVGHDLVLDDPAMDMEFGSGMGDD